MKKNITLFLILAFLALNSAKGQAFPGINENPVWKVGVWYFWTGNCEAFHWKYGKAVKACGLDYIEVLECNSLGNDCQLKGYVRTRDEKVFARKTLLCTETDRLMYDFGLAGDTSYQMAYNIGSYDSTLCSVKASRNYLYKGQYRLTQFLNYIVDPPANNYTDDMMAIRGIGSDVHPFFALTCFGDFCETNLQLMEYRENNVVMFEKNPVFPLPCKTWMSVEEKSTELKVDIFPNPFSGFVHILASFQEPLEVRIYDVTSRKLIQQSFTQGVSLDMSLYASGVYLYEITGRNGWVSQGRIVKE